MFLKNTTAGVVCFNLFLFPGPQIPAFCRTPYVCHAQIHSHTLEHRYENENGRVSSKFLTPPSALLRALFLKKTQIMCSLCGLVFIISYFVFGVSLSKTLDNHFVKG